MARFMESVLIAFFVIKLAASTCNTDHQIGCANGTCIPKELKCNGKHDCHVFNSSTTFDNSDEAGCSMPSDLAKLFDFPINPVYIGKNCPDNEFQCPHGGCLHKDKRCNGIRDCVEADEVGHDEHNCDYAAIIPQDKRIICRAMDWESHDPRFQESINSGSIPTSAEDCDGLNCWWDSDKGKCYEKYTPNTSGQKCSNCYKIGEHDVFCYRGNENFESCDTYLAKWKHAPGVGDINVAKCAQFKHNGVRYSSCVPASWCNEHFEGMEDVNCCAGNYCNDLANELLESRSYVEPPPIVIYQQSYQPRMANNNPPPRQPAPIIMYEAPLEGWKPPDFSDDDDEDIDPKSDKSDTDEDQGSTIKSNIIACCIIALTLAMIAV